MLGLTTILSLITAVAAAAAAAAAKGSPDPCTNGVYHPNAYHETKIHCNTALGEKEHRIFRKAHYRANNFTSCINDCFGPENGQNCCAAQYNKETKVCIAAFSDSSVCSLNGRNFVGAGNDTFDLAVQNYY